MMLCAMPMLTMSVMSRSDRDEHELPTFASCDLLDLCPNRLCKVFRRVAGFVRGFCTLSKLCADAGYAAGDINESFVDGHGLQVVRMCHEDRVELERELLVPIPQVRQRLLDHEKPHAPLKLIRDR